LLITSEQRTAVLTVYKIMSWLHMRDYTKGINANRVDKSYMKGQ